MPNRVLTEEPPPDGVGSSDKRRVLVADDDRAIRESLARALELEGYDVATAVDGVEALTRIRRDGFDALVVDVMMPAVDGLAVCRLLRAALTKIHGRLEQQHQAERDAFVAKLAAKLGISEAKVKEVIGSEPHHGRRGP